MPGPSSQLLPLFQTLVEIVAKLRGPDGCPWDKEQTSTSLAPYAIEETYELVEAIESGKSEDVKEELGDFLFQVILQAQVAQDEGKFELVDVIQALNQKMVRRHPHVFGQPELKTAQEVLQNWDKVKSKEKQTRSDLFSYPRNMPALQAAAKIGRKTQGWKFDWSTAEEVLLKVTEELEETREALANFRTSYPKGEIHPEAPGREELTHEIGDLLFSSAQLARHLGLDPEACLREGNRRFEGRFQQVVAKAGLAKEDFASLPDVRKEQLWHEVKLEAKKNS